MKRRSADLALSLSLLSLAAMPTLAADVNEHSIKFGYSVPEAHPLGKGANRFAELVAQKSGGKIKVKNYPATLLCSEVQMISATQGGVQEIVGVSSTPLVGLARGFAVFDLPFLFNSEREVDALVDGPVGAQLFERLQAKNLFGLCFWENGFRHVTNSKHPIVKPEDLMGLKIRTMQNPVYVETFNALGANAMPMAWPEVYAALESRAIDAQENPFAIVSTNKVNEVQKYLSVTKHAYSPYAVMVGSKLWHKLTPAERTILRESCSEARDYQREGSREEDAKPAAELRARGTAFNEVLAATVTALKQQLAPVTEKFTKQIGEGLVAQVQAEIARVRTR